jgi:hypothetical protein
MSAVRSKSVMLGGLLALLLVAGGLASRAAASQEDLDVLKVIPHNYKLLLDNAVVRVIEARIPPGTVEPPHRHMRGVSVCMGDYVIEHLAEPGGSWRRSARKLGDVYWSESSVHQTRNVGTTPSHTIRIELKF